MYGGYLQSKNVTYVVLNPALFFPVFLVLGGLSLWLSLVLVLKLWVNHPEAILRRKIFWTVVLLMPLIGPMVYGALFNPLPPHNIGGRNRGSVYPGLRG
jgi:hypothetical protein